MNVQVAVSINVGLKEKLLQRIVIYVWVRDVVLYAAVLVRISPYGSSGKDLSAPGVQTCGRTETLLSKGLDALFRM